MNEIEMRQNRSFAALVFVVILGLGVALAYTRFIVGEGAEAIGIGVSAFILASIVSSSIQVADQWNRAVILRMGKFHALKGPGLFFIIPVVDVIPYWIDTRVITTGFKAEKTLTKDTVPVDVDAVLFWKVIDPQKAALAVADYQGAISWASQTALRDVIGKTMLSEMLEGRDHISVLLQKIIDERTEPWGINVISVEVKDVLIPTTLENAMSMQAQAERERQARVILGDAERQIAEKFAEAGKTYEHNPVAFHLRAMNMLYEGLKENATIVHRAQHRRRVHAAWRAGGDDRADHGHRPGSNQRAQQWATRTGWRRPRSWPLAGLMRMRVSPHRERKLCGRNSQLGETKTKTQKNENHRRKD